jgi:hypothetical protein
MKMDIAISPRRVLPRSALHGSSKITCRSKIAVEQGARLNRGQGYAICGCRERAFAQACSPDDQPWRRQARQNDPTGKSPQILSSPHPKNIPLSPSRLGEKLGVKRARPVGMVELRCVIAAGNTFTTAEIYPAVIKALGYTPEHYPLASLRYDLSKLRACSTDTGKTQHL